MSKTKSKTELSRSESEGKDEALASSPVRVLQNKYV